MAYSLNGSSQYMSVGTAVVTTPPLTMACLLYLTSYPGSGQAYISMSIDDGPTYRSFRQQIASTGYLRSVVLNDDASAVAVAVSSSVVPLNTWCLATSVFTSSVSRQSFVNGLGGTVNTTSISISAPTRTILGMTSGSNDTADQFLPGRIAEAVIWNAALTASEIASLAAGFTPDQIRPQSLQFYAPLVRDLVDVRGGRTITNVNGATVATHPRIIT